MQAATDTVAAGVRDRQIQMKEIHPPPAPANPSDANSRTGSSQPRLDDTATSGGRTGAAQGDSAAILLTDLVIPAQLVGAGCVSHIASKVLALRISPLCASIRMQRPSVGVGYRGVKR